MAASLRGRPGLKTGKNTICELDSQVNKRIEEETLKRHSEHLQKVMVKRTTILEQTFQLTLLGQGNLVKDI